VFNLWNVNVYAKQDVCNACLALSNDKRFRNVVARSTPTPENRKFTPKYYLKTNTLVNYLQHTDIQKLYQLLTDISKNLDSDFDFAFWQMFANKASQDAFDKKPVFKDLC